jgi:hypothetical protein
MKAEQERPEMSDETVSNRGQVIDTTDSLEAVSVFRGWKNFFFLIVLVCLLIVQIAFWLIDTKTVPVPPERMNPPELNLAAAPPTLTPAPSEPSPTASGQVPPTTDANTISPTATAPKASGPAILAWFTFDRIARIIEVVNGVLIITASLFCLATFFSLMVSLIGRLGGINHISRAFFLSLIMAVLVQPWQKLLGMDVPGVIYSPAELIAWLQLKAGSPSGAIIYYVRFVGYWVIVLLLLLMSQWRSARWTKSILRRLEII